MTLNGVMAIIMRHFTKFGSFLTLHAGENFTNNQLYFGNGAR